MTVSLLHISDLHRDPRSHLGNRALLESLIRDAERYTTDDHIRWPDLVVASGDIVQGVPATQANADAELTRQYDEAEQFLDELAKTFVGGDRRRVVLIPGNHDVAYPRVMASLEECDPKDARGMEELVRRLREPTSELRWSWADLAFYIIRHPDVYETRLEHFTAFYQRYYGGQRKYSLNPAEQVDFFDYPDLNFTIAAFCSCYNNDPLNTAGLIHPESIARAGSELRQPKYTGRVLVATYHHSTSGPPLHNDYMDADVLQNLLDYGVVLTLHGHQHRAAVVDERFALGGGRKLTLVSAGTLCGGPTALPAGHMRGYNIVEVDEQAWETRVYPRRMHNQTFPTPVWGPALGPLSPPGGIVVPLGARPASRSALVRQALGRGEELIRSRAFDEALKILEPYVPADSLARRLALEALSHLGDDRRMIAMFYPPTSVAEAVLLAGALWDTHDHARLMDLLSLPLVAGSSDPAAREVIRKYSGRVKP